MILVASIFQGKKWNEIKPTFYSLFYLSSPNFYYSREGLGWAGLAALQAITCPTLFPPFLAYFSTLQLIKAEFPQTIPCPSA